MKTPNILIVEDQDPLDGLVEAVEEVFPKYYSGFNKQNHASAQCYNEAEKLISENHYDFVLLDHRLPIQNQRELMKSDFDAFCKTLKNIGYSLIPLIIERNPDAVIIGTSSLSRSELREYTALDFKLDKVSMHVSQDLEKIVSQFLSAKGGEK